MQVRMLSGGECRRLQLAAVLMARPNLLILDEVRNPISLPSGVSFLVSVLNNLFLFLRSFLCFVA